MSKEDAINQKKDNKLDTFLKRNLDAASFEQLRHTEPCIVIGERFDKVFSFVAVGHEWIYITENPPKTVKKEVNFQHITAIELKNDLPEFLAGQERANTLHAVIKYKVPVRQRALGKAMSNNLAPSSLRPMPKSLSAPDVKLPVRPQSASPRLDRRRQQASVASSDDEDEYFAKMSDGSISPRSSSPVDSLYMSEGQFTLPSTNGNSSNTPQINSEGKRPSSPRSDIQRNTDDASIAESSKINSEPLPSLTPPQSPNMSAKRTPQAIRKNVVENKSLLPSHKECILHLYMLKSDSPVLNHLSNAWNNYVIRATLSCDVVFELKTTQNSKTSAPERLGGLFDQLSQEVLMPDNTIEDLFGLMNELKTATEKNFTLKKLFWKYGDLFPFTVNLLKKYIPGLKLSEFSDVSIRADEIELANLMLEMISLEMREADVLPQRAMCLRKGSGCHVTDLISLATSFPLMPDPYHVPAKGASALLQSGSEDTRRDSINREFSELGVEFTRTSSSVVYEMFLLAKQDMYCAGSVINLGMMVKKIQEIKNTESFVERVFAHSMTLLSPNSREKLNPKDALLLYQQLYVLQTLLNQCPNVLIFLRAKFMEEFKYYIQAPVLWCKLPVSYCISKPIIKILERMSSRVLSKEIKLSLPEVTVSCL